MGASPTPRTDLVTAAAEVAGVCARPVVSRVTDLEAKEVRLVPDRLWRHDGEQLQAVRGEGPEAPELRRAGWAGR